MPVIKLDKKWQEEEKRIYDRGHKYDQQAKQPRHTTQYSNLAEFFITYKISHCMGKLKWLKD